MAGFNGSGTHVRAHNWVTDKANTVAVTASRMDAEDDVIAESLSNTICRDGQSTTTARIPFAAGVSAAAGTTSAVSYAQINDLNTGFYFPAADQVGIVAGGTEVITATSTTVTLTGAVSASAAFLPVNSDGGALGSATKMWSDLFLASGAVINFNNGDVTVTHSANNLAFAGATNYTYDAKISPLIDDGAPLGDTSHQFSDLFLASGGVISWNNNDVTITHSSNQIAIAGGALACEALSPSGDVAVATNKFTVASASGNTAIAGTLAVTGASTLTGALTANNAAGVTAKNTAKAWGLFSISGTTLTTDASLGVTSITRAGVGLYDVVIPDAGSTNYTIVANIQRTGGVAQIPVYSSKVSTGFRITAVTPGTGTQESEMCSFEIKYA